MSRNVFSKSGGPKTYTLDHPGRQYEMQAFGDTAFFHVCTCYVQSPVARAAIRQMRIDGADYDEIVSKWGAYIDPRAPIIRMAKEQK